MTVKYNEIASLEKLLTSIKTEGDCADLVRKGVSEDASRIIVYSPLDMHLHLRDGNMLDIVAKESAKTFAGGVIMPNLTPSIETLEQLLGYKERIHTALKGETFEPHMTLNFRNYTREELTEAKEHIIGIKMYPKGQTTNSERGVDGSQIETYKDTLKLMEELEIPLLVHGERIDGGDKIDELDKERKFKSIYEELAQTFPKLKIVMEHVSTKEIISLVDKYENLYATVTLHHLLMIHNHIVGGGTKTHIMCMPIPKLWDDRKELLRQVLSGNPKIMFGSDSAPHQIGNKESACGCAGVFTAPIALQALAEIFESFGQLENLSKFIGENAENIYGIKSPEKSIILERNLFTIPNSYGNGKNTIVPFLAGKELSWDIKTA